MECSVAGKFGPPQDGVAQRRRSPQRGLGGKKLATGRTSNTEDAGAEERERRWLRNGRGDGCGREGGHAAALSGEEESGSTVAVACDVCADGPRTREESEGTERLLGDRGEREGDTIAALPEDDGGAVRHIGGVVNRRCDDAALISGEQDLSWRGAEPVDCRRLPMFRAALQFQVEDRL